MKNKKGFTLIELVVVVLVLGMLILIAVPTIQKFMNKGKVSYYNSIENEIKRAGMDYAETYKTILPKKIGNVVTIDLDEIVDNKYMDPVVDENGNKCTGYVTIKKVKTDSYNYYAYLDCGDLYTSDELDISEDDNTYDEDGDYDINIDEVLRELEQQGYTIDLNQKKVIVSQGDNVNLPYAKVYDKNGNLVKSDLGPKPSKVDTSVLGTTKVMYAYRSTKKHITVEVIDNNKPSKPEIVLKYDDSKGNSYRGDWYSGNIYAEFKSTDYVKKGIMGSGIKEYQVSMDKEVWTTISGNNEIRQEEGHYIRYVRSVDNSGNISDISEFEYKIDKTNPNVGSIEIVGGTLDGSNRWYTNNVVVKVTAGVDKCEVNECSTTQKVTYQYETVSTKGVTKKAETEITSGNTFTISANGVSTITVYTYDYAKNRSDATTYIVRKDEPVSESYHAISTSATNYGVYSAGPQYFTLVSHVHTGSSSSGGGCYGNHHTGTRYCTCTCSEWRSGSSCSDFYQSGPCGKTVYHCVGCGYTWVKDGNGITSACGTYDYYSLSCGKTPKTGTVTLQEATNNQRTRLRIVTNGIGSLSNVTWTGDVLLKNANEVILNSPGNYTVTFTYANGDYTRSHTFTYTNKNQLQ